MTGYALMKIGEWIPDYDGAIALKNKNGTWSIGHSNSVDPSSKWNGPNGRNSDSGPEMMKKSGYVAWIPLDKVVEDVPVERKPFGYFHELLDHKGEGDGVWLGCEDRSVVEKSYTEGETGKEIIALYTEK